MFFHVPRLHPRWAERLEEFRQLVRSPDISESDIQNFLGRNPEFLTGIDYERAVPHVYIEGHDEGALIPDFMLIPFQSNFADVLELKHPRHKILVKQGKHLRFSASVIKAIAQLRDYEQFFDNKENRDRVKKQYGFTAYKPKMIMITTSSLQSEIQFRKVAADYRKVSVLTYDDVIARAERMLQFR